MDSLLDSVFGRQPVVPAAAAAPPAPVAAAAAPAPAVAVAPQYTPEQMAAHIQKSTALLAACQTIQINANLHTPEAIAGRTERYNAVVAEARQRHNTAQADEEQRFNAHNQRAAFVRTAFIAPPREANEEDATYQQRVAAARQQWDLVQQMTEQQWNAQPRAVFTRTAFAPPADTPVAPLLTEVEKQGLVAGALQGQPFSWDLVPHFGANWDTNCVQLMSLVPFGATITTDQAKKLAITAVEQNKHDVLQALFAIPGLADKAAIANAVKEGCPIFDMAMFANKLPIAKTLRENGAVVGFTGGAYSHGLMGSTTTRVCWAIEKFAGIFVTGGRLKNAFSIANMLDSTVWPGLMKTIGRTLMSIFSARVWLAVGGIILTYQVVRLLQPIACAQRAITKIGQGVAAGFNKIRPYVAGGSGINVNMTNTLFYLSIACTIYKNMATDDAK